MKNIFSAMLMLGVIALSNAAFSQDKWVVRDANAEERKVSDFKGIKVSGAISLYLSQGNVNSLAVSSASKDDLSDLITEVKDGVLHVYPKPNTGKKWFNWTSESKKYKAYVSFKSINLVAASGASNIYVQGKIAGEELVVKLSGASDFKGGVNVSNLKLNLLGASDVAISGKATHCDITSSGASDVKGYDLHTDFTSVSSTGASTVKLTINKEVKAKASGASDVYFYGDAKILEHKSSGASSIKRKS